MEITFLEYVKGLWDLLENKATKFSRFVIRDLGIGKYPQVLSIEIVDDLIKIKCKNSLPESVFKKLLNLYKCSDYEIALYIFGKGRKEIRKRVTVDVDPISLRKELILPEEELKEEEIETKFFKLHSKGEELTLEMKNREEVKQIFLKLAKEIFPFLRIPTFANSIVANILLEIKNDLHGLKEGEIKIALKLNNNPFGMKLGSFKIQT